ETASSVSTPDPRDSPLSKPSRRRIRADRPSPAPNTDFTTHNNNNNQSSHVKNERLSPATPPEARSRSVTPSSAQSHPGTPPSAAAQEGVVGMIAAGRNYSDFMRSLAAKYNNANPNDYFSAARNGCFPPSPATLDPRFKPSFPLLPTGLTPQPPPTSKDPPPISATPSPVSDQSKKTDFTSVLNPFASVTGAAAVFPPLIDMSTTQTLLAMVRTAKEAELQGLLKNVKRPDVSSPLDLSSAAPPVKRPRIKTPSVGSPNGITTAQPSVKRADSESPRLHHEDISNWSVDDVCSFVANIDICAEYAQIQTRQLSLSRRLKQTFCATCAIKPLPV
ncbi:unnamed protein product, partial [Acanthoscelides obtectus]